VVSEEYEYDLAGKRTSFKKNGALHQSSFVYNDQDQLLSFLDHATNQTVTFTYNTDGDLIERLHPGVERATYSYDHFGRLIGVTLDAAANGSVETVTSYTLDPLGRRVAKAINGVTTRRWLYGSFLYPSVEFNGDGIPIAYFVGNVMLKVNSGADDGTYRLIRDQIGSVRSVVNVGTGEIKQRLDYDSYGNVVLDTYPGFQPLGFAGGLYDSHTTLVKFGFRDYDPTTGRFTTKDPIGLNGGANVYLYAMGNPVVFVDRVGLGPKGIDSQTDKGKFYYRYSGIHTGIVLYDPNQSEWIMIDYSDGNQNQQNSFLRTIDAFIPSPGAVSIPTVPNLESAKDYSTDTFQYMGEISSAEAQDIRALATYYMNNPPMYSLPFSNCKTMSLFLWNNRAHGPSTIPKPTTPEDEQRLKDLYTERISNGYEGGGGLWEPGLIP
jgi:RHS repeat-associated protein